MARKRIIVIGAGNIGSRHLQALKAVKRPLEIFVVEPNSNSLAAAKERYGSVPAGKFVHKIDYSAELPGVLRAVDLAIVATCSDIRADAVRDLLKKTNVRFIVLEKLLFQKKSDYGSVGALLKKNGTKAWVNCPMRMMPMYHSAQADFHGRRLFYTASWSGYGLVTSAIHYADHMVFLSGCDDFTLVTDGIDQKPIPSKRSGFLELTGALTLLFKNGSVGSFVCHTGGDAPSLVQFYCSKARHIIRETESRAWVSRSAEGWKWNELEVKIPFQSQLTTELVEGILHGGICRLPQYEQSAKIHLQLLEPLRIFLNRHSKKKYDCYPFT